MTPAMTSFNGVVGNLYLSPSREVDRVFNIRKTIFFYLCCFRNFPRFIVPTRVCMRACIFLKHHPRTRGCVGTECLIIAIFVILFTIIDDNPYAKLNNHLSFIGSRRDFTQFSTDLYFLLSVPFFGLIYKEYSNSWQ